MKEKDKILKKIKKTKKLKIVLSAKRINTMTFDCKNGLHATQYGLGCLGCGYKYVDYPYSFSLFS